jgi:hypothetical protein
VPGSGTLVMQPFVTFGPGAATAEVAAVAVSPVVRHAVTAKEAAARVVEVVRRRRTLLQRLSAGQVTGR